MRRTAIFALICAALAAGLIIWGLGAADSERPAARIQSALLLVEDDTGTYLMQLRKGLQEAVQERGGTLSVERLSDFDPVNRQTSYENYSALYLLSEKPEDYLPALHGKDIPVIVLGKEVRGEICALPDEEAGGRALGAHAAALFPGGHVLIIGNELEARDTLRLKGIMAGLSGLSSALLAPDALDRAGTLQPDAILALSDTSLDAALALRGQDSTALFGFDAAETRLALMESGELAGIAADDPYALGYIAGSMLDDILEDGGKPFVRLSPRRLVTRESMYDAANVKLIFPLLH